MLRTFLALNPLGCLKPPCVGGSSFPSSRYMTEPKLAHVGVTVLRTSQSYET